MSAPTAAPRAAAPAPPEPRRPRDVRAVEAYAVAPQAALVLAMRAAFRRPAWVAAGAMALVCVPSHTSDVSASVHITAIDLGTVLVVACVLPIWLRAAAGLARPALSRAVCVLLGAVVVVSSIATATSADPHASLSGLVRYLQLFVIVPAAVATLVRAASPRDRTLLLVAAVLTGLIEAAIGTWQTLTVTGASYQGRDVRAVGTFGSLDVMGMATVVGLGIVAGVCLALNRRGRARVLAWSAVAAMTPGMVFSLSRGAWLATGAAATLVSLALAGRAAVKALVLLGAAVFVVLGLGLVPAGSFASAGSSSAVLTRITSIGSAVSAPDQSVLDRYSLWTAAVGIWRDHPVTGVGPKQFAQYRDGYAPISLSAGGQAADPSHPFQVEPLLSPHNLYLLTLAEQGLPGATAFAALLVGVPVIGLVGLVRGRRAALPRDRLTLYAVAAGWGVWSAIDFVYADIGGASTVYYSILLGVILTGALPGPRAGLREPSAGAGAPVRRRRRIGVLVRGSLLTAGFSLAGSLLGLARDLLLARFFGAVSGTDAFLVAWTVPETAAPLLIEDGMSYLMVPLFSRASVSRQATRRAVNATWLPLLTAVGAAAAAVALLAPVLVRLLAPGLADPALAVRCTRLTAITVLMFGLTGYAAAALRSHHVFGPPASIYVAYNLGILALMIAAHDTWGVAAAAGGVALGAVLMVAVQAPFFVRTLGAPGRPTRGAAAVTLAAVAPIAVFTLVRQAQVYVERFLGSELPTGTISHLNYAQKVAQVPMSLSVMLAVVSFPTLSRAIQAGRVAEARRRMTRDLAIAAGAVTLATLFLLAFAPWVIAVLFQHGAFTARDTAATASIMRVYALGLLGQTVVGVTCRLHFSTRASWFPAAAMAPGLLATAAVGRLTLHTLGASGIALGNAAGITLTAALLLAHARRALSPTPRGRTQ
ncbi:MAG TPA: lipid II flippase MurJ [Actinocrinis sp.]|nr:lipid II flippase MurJ [Actinocrinis sp.]